MRIALGVEYDGRAFCGWQFQDHSPSVQEAVEKALSKVANHFVRVVCAGRTDTGVHATEQVIHFDTASSDDAALDLNLDASDTADADIGGGDEVGTKLDLAKAYIDMGDPEGARSILDEVMDEGSSTQKEEAQSLLGQIA